GRSPDRRREYAQAPQYDRMYAVLLLPMGSAGPAAGLVQIGAVSLARGQRSARRARRFRHHPAGRHPNPHMGFDGGDALHRSADAPGRHGWLERGEARGAGHAGLHDRHRPAEASKRGRLMDGIHDMGGMHGFGKVEAEKNEPVFHAAWEGRCLALNRAMGAIGAWTIDEGRAGIEELPPDVYLASSYYGKWALRLHNMVIARGLAGADELAAGHARREAKPLPRKLTAADVPGTLTRGSFGRPAPAPARFAVGARGRTKHIH